VFKIKQQQEMTTKLILVVIGLTSVSAILIPTYAAPAITSADIVDNTIVSADLKDGSAVRSTDIVDGQVNTADLANNAVTSPKIQDGQVNAADLGTDAVTTAKIKNGEVKAEDIAPGVISGGGALQVETREQFFDDPPGSGNDLDYDSFAHTFHVSCNSDEALTGGGYSSNSDDTIIRYNRPTADNNGWLVIADNPTSHTLQIGIYAMCAKIVG
jgi:hypothetical protein